MNKLILEYHKIVEPGLDVQEAWSALVKSVSQKSVANWYIQKFVMNTGLLLRLDTLAVTFGDSCLFIKRRSGEPGLAPLHHAYLHD